MALDPDNLVQEVFARGFSYLDDSGAGTNRVRRWVEDAWAEIDEADDWLYLKGTATGSAPLTISDLDTVSSVYDATNQRVLMKADSGSLVDRFGDLALTGTPVYWYRPDPTTISVFPVQAVSLSVGYMKFSSAPLMPDRFRMAILEYACAKAYLDSDNPQMASVCRSEGDRIVDLMRGSYADYQQFIVTNGCDW